MDLWLQTHPGWHVLPVEVVRSGELVATALLGYRRRLFWIDVVRLGPQGMGGWIAARDDAALHSLAVAVRQALDGLHRPWRLRFAVLRNSDAAVSRFISALTRARVCDVARSAQLHVPSGVPFSEVVSRNNRSAVAKARNRVAREGHRLEIVWLTAFTDIAAVLPEVDAVHQARNRQLRGVGRGLDYPATSRQFTQRVLEFAAQGRAQVLLTRIDGDLAAFAVCFRDGSALHVYENLAAPAWLHYSPGAVANHELAAHAWADPEIDVLDWGLGLQRYKLSGNVELVEHRTVVAYSSAVMESASHIRQALRALLGPLVRLQNWLLQRSPEGPRGKAV